MRRIWPIDGDDRLQIPNLLKQWGYPRDLWPGELAISWWYGVGDEGLFWYNSAITEDGPDPPHSAMVHVCFHPEARGKVTRRELLAVELIAELRGLRLLLTSPPSDRQAEALLRLGWERRKDGVLTKELT